MTDTGMEPVVAERFIMARLLTRSALLDAVGGAIDPRLYGHAAPQSESGEPDYPFVLWSQAATSDVGALGGVHIWSVIEYVVRVVGQVESWDPLITAAAEIHVALENQSGVVTGGEVFACTRVRPFMLPEVRNGVQYRHIGGTYRLLCKGEV